MAVDIVGPIYRNLSEILGTAVAQVRKEIGKLTKQISGGLRGLPKTKDRFDKGMAKPADSLAQLNAALKAQRKVDKMVAKLKTFANKDLIKTSKDLDALINLLQALGTIEQTRKVFEKLAKSFGR